MINKTCISLAIGLLCLSNVKAESVFVTLENDNALAIVDPIAGQLIKTIPIGQRPRGIAISPDYSSYMSPLAMTTPSKSSIRSVLRRSVSYRLAKTLKPLL